MAAGPSMAPWEQEVLDSPVLLHRPEGQLPGSFFYCSGRFSMADEAPKLRASELIF